MASRCCIPSDFLVLVLSETVLVLERAQMTEPFAKALNGAERHARDQWLRAAQSIPLNIAEGNGKQSLKDRNRFFEIARGSALECAAIHDVLVSFEAIDLELNRFGKTNLKRIVSMLTRLIQRTDSVSEGSIDSSTRRSTNIALDRSARSGVLELGPCDASRAY